MEYVTAYTEPGGFFPPYYNLSRYEDGRYRLIVRSAGHNGAKDASIDLTSSQLWDLVTAAQADLQR